MKECRFCCFSRKIYYHFPIQKNMDKFFLSFTETILLLLNFTETRSLPNTLVKRQKKDHQQKSKFLLMVFIGHLDLYSSNAKLPDIDHLLWDLPLLEDFPHLNGRRLSKLASKSFSALADTRHPP